MSEVFRKWRFTVQLESEVASRVLKPVPKKELHPFFKLALLHAVLELLLKDSDPPVLIEWRRSA